MNIQQILNLVASYAGWFILALALGFAFFIIWQLYKSRDPEKVAAKKAAEEAAKLAKKQESEARAEARNKGKIVDITASRDKLQEAFRDRGGDIDRNRIIKQTAEAVKEVGDRGVAQPSQTPYGNPSALPTSSNPTTSFFDLGDDEEELDKLIGIKKNQEGSGNGFPPPPPRL